MKLKLKTMASIQEGKLVFEYREQVEKFLYQLAGSIKENKIVVTFEEWRKKRTNDQNALYWFYLGIISDETGNDVDCLHDQFRLQFLGMRTFEVDGKIYETLKSTTELSTKEFTNYLEQINATTGIPVPNLWIE